MTLAIFDIDGTLVRGSTERRFWRFLLARHRLGPSRLLAYVGFLLRFLPRYGVHVVKKDKAYLAGLDTKELATLVDEFFTLEVVPRIDPAAVQRLQLHLRRGDVVALLSGTLEPIASALARHLGVEHVCAAVCAERDGRYAAQPPLIHPFGDEKVALAARLAAQLGTDLRLATAYADSKHDLPLLEAVGTPVAVSPDRRLRREAAARGWEVIASGAQTAAGRRTRAAERGYM
jgi:HAD superfamily hydrolase (TIGR01490 family)